MALFKEKKKKKSTDNIKLTLDAKHKQFLSKLDENKDLLPQLENELKELCKQFNELDKLELWDLSDDELDNKFNLKDKIDEYKTIIKNIYNNTDETDYFLNTSHILFNYYEKKNKTQLSSNIDINKNENSVLNFFQKNDEINKNDESDDEHNKYKNMTKGDILSHYLNYTTDNYILEYDNEEDSYCPHCKTENKIHSAEGINICTQCGYQNYILIDYDKPSYKDPPREISYFAYKRINHFNEWLAQFQAKESTEIAKDNYDKIKEEIYKEQITDLNEITPPKLREILKKLKLNKYYEHVPHIINRLSGNPAPIITRDLEEKLRMMFKEIQNPWIRHCPNKRSNFLSYSYVLFKCLQLLEMDKFLKHFSLLKSREKLAEQDKIWKKICNELKWEYIKTI